MTSWIERIGELTAEHREAKATAFARQAGRRKWKRREEGYSERYAVDDGRWHRARERGQRERIVRVQECGCYVIRVSCLACGQIHEYQSACRIGLLCLSCRNAIAAKKRSAFAQARMISVDEALRRGLFRSDRRGGRWGEKFLTLTTPHWPSQSVAARINVVLGAWPLFLRRLNRYWKAKGIRSAEWFRVIEWTPGTDGRGHPHLHVWLLSPFLPREDVERWWREALQEQSGLPIARVIVDIREVEPGGAELELIKYLTKDIAANGEKLAPEVYAEVYKALDGARSTQASKGFMGKAKRAANQCECGVALRRRVQRFPAGEEQFS